jgi:hypothetical protein
MSEPLRCEWCDRTDRGPFYKVSIQPKPITPEPQQVCQGCLEDLGLAFPPLQTFAMSFE